jgi:hypothetical protein
VISNPILLLLQTPLCWNLTFIGIASVVLVAGVSLLLLAVIRSCQRVLFWVGIFSILYAIRVFIQNALVHAAIGASEERFALWSLCLTYVIPIPYALSARELFGAGWKRSISAWLWIEIAFAAAAIPLALLSRKSDLTDLTNNILVIGGTLLVLLHVLSPPYVTLIHQTPNMAPDRLRSVSPAYEFRI